MRAEVGERRIGKISISDRQLIIDECNKLAVRIIGIVEGERRETLPSAE